MKLNIYCIFLRGKSALKIGCSITFQQPDVRQSGTSVKTIDMNFWWFYIGVLFADLVTLKGCGMGPWLVLVSPCFRENVIATCKIGSFLCSLDNLLQKNVIVLFFRKSNFKMALIEKSAIFDLLVTFFSHQGKLQKLLQHISHSHTYTYFAHPIDFFCLTNFEKKIRIYQIYGFSLVWVLVGILIRAILEQSIQNKMVSKI